MGDMNPQLDNVEQTTMNSDRGKKVSVVKIRFDLENPVSDSMYQYLSENIENSNSKTSVQKSIDSQIDVKQLKIDLPLEQIDFANKIPLYDFYAAAGTFSEMQSEKEYHLTTVQEKYATADYFACRVIGESMNKIIPNNSICLFKKYFAGSRTGKILLIENRDVYDPDFNSAFTIKTYTSEKIINEDGWKHNAIVLKPNSFDKSFKSIIINEENSQEMRIIGEFVSVIL